MKKIVIEVDKCEKRPIVFPKSIDWRGRTLLVETEAKDMRKEGADYRLKMNRYVCGIERKGLPTEVYSCVCGGDLERFRKQLSKLKANYRMPVLLVDSSPAEILGFNYKLFVPSADRDTGFRVQTRLVNEASSAGVAFVQAGRTESAAGLYALGQTVLAVLLGAAEKSFIEKGLTPEQAVDNLMKSVDSVPWKETQIGSDHFAAGACVEEDELPRRDAGA